MLRKFFSIIFLLAAFQYRLCAQIKNPVKFGVITKNDFDISRLVVDTTKGAVILSDIGYSSFEGNNEGWFSIVYKCQRRIKVINKNGFELANIEIPLYKKNEDEEKLENVKACTYNLEDGKIVETKLSKEIIFTDKADTKHVYKKFTLPAVKEGSIIEYSYIIRSPFLFNLQPWVFQGQYPRVWSEYEADIPAFFDYVVLTQGYLPFFSKTTTIDNGAYSVLIPGKEAWAGSQTIQLTSGVLKHKWIMKDVEPFKEENFIASSKNLISQIEFQMAGIQLPDKPYENVMGNWDTAYNKLMAKEDFGAGLEEKNKWLDNDIKIITQGAKSDLEKAKKIYYYVKNTIKSTDKEGILTEKSLKDVFKDKNGSVAEINLLLVAILRHENIMADPVILSTRENGYSHSAYPLMDKYNYVLCKTVIDSESFYLDATKPYLGFGILQFNCYNDSVRVINKKALAFSFSPDSLQQPITTNVLFEKGKTEKNRWEGDIVIIENMVESNTIREEIGKKGKDAYKQNISAASENITVADIKIDGLENYEAPIQISYSIKIQGDNADSIIYFNPVLNNKYKENPFEDMVRVYPVELPYPINDNYSINIEIPEGYEVEELPKSAKVLFNDTEGLFEYYVSKNDKAIRVQTHIKFEKATFPAEDYQNLRSFFDYIVKKYNEQLVFKKRK